MKVKLNRFKTINFRLNPANCTRVSKVKKLASPADVISTLGLRPLSSGCQPHDDNFKPSYIGEDLMKF